MKNKQPAVVEDDETTESDDDGAQLADSSSEPATFTYDDTRLHPLDHRAFAYPELLEISAEQQRAIRGELVLDEFFERTALRAGLLHDQIDDAFNRDDKKALSTINKKKARLSNGVWQVRHQGSWRIWIPLRCAHLQARIIAIAHNGMRCHPSHERTANEIKGFFYWRALAEFVKLAVQDCLICNFRRGSKYIPRPLGCQEQVSAPGIWVFADYFDVTAKTTKSGKKRKSGDAPEEENVMAALLMMDRFSRFIRIFAVTKKNAKSTMDALLEWIREDGIPKVLSTDTARHFVNDAMKQLMAHLKIDYHPASAYVPQSNGAVENAIQRALRDTFAVVMEHRDKHHHWSDYKDLVASALNDSPMEVLGGRTPREVHTGRKASGPLDVIVEPPATAKSLPQVSGLKPDLDAIAKHANELEQLLRESHAAVRVHSDEVQGRYRLNTDKRRSAKALTVEPGQYVMLLDQLPRLSKLNARRSGPHQVQSQESEHSFTICNIVSGKEVDGVHPDRLEFYSDARLTVTDEMRQINAHNMYGYEVSRFGDYWFDASQQRWLVKLLWKGFEDDEDFQSTRDFKETLEAMTPLTLRFIRKLGSPPSKANMKQDAKKISDYLGLDFDWILSAKITEFNDVSVEALV